MSTDENWDQSGLVGKKMAGGRYLILSEVASDARRTLYEAENVELGIRVNLDVVRVDGSATAERLRNGEKLCTLNRPGLVGVLDVGKLDGGLLYMASERAVGPSLRTLITGKLLEQRRALTIMRQVLDALAAVHEAGAIHGDIKPENIIVRIEGDVDRVKLADFGVATLAGATKAGDPRYAAPESALGAIDARGDIYSVGAVLFELLTGHPPFFAADASALRRLHAYGPMQTLKQRAPELSFNHALEELVAMALTKKRDARLQSARDMIAVLDHALQSIEELAGPPPEAPRRRKPNDSLLLLAKDLMPASSQAAGADAPVVPVNVGRHVPQVPWQTRASSSLRKAFEQLRAFAAKRVASVRATIARLSRTQRRVIGGVLVTLVVAIVVVIVASSGSKPKPVAAREKPLVEDDSAEPVLADQGSGAEEKGEKERGEKERGEKERGEKERGENTDRVASWMLELEQATTCDQRRAAIAKLAGSSDRRALPALEKAKAHKCVEREARAAIRRITARKH